MVRHSFPGAHAGCADPLPQVVAAALPEDALWDPAAWGERVGSRARVQPPRSPCIDRDFVWERTSCWVLKMRTIIQLTSLQWKRRAFSGFFFFFRSAFEKNGDEKPFLKLLRLFKAYGRFLIAYSTYLKRCGKIGSDLQHSSICTWAPYSIANAIALKMQSVIYMRVAASIRLMNCSGIWVKFIFFRKCLSKP